MRFAVIAAGILVLLAACGTYAWRRLDTALFLDKIVSTDGLRIATDLPYGALARQRLDVYAPADARDAPGGTPGGAPVVVFLYGGTWQFGERGFYRFLGATLAQHGIVAVIPDYRLYPQVTFPDFLRDCAAAVAWASRNAAQYGGDPRALFVMGHSAGAYNATMLALDDRWLAEQGLPRQPTLAGAIGLSGPYDFLPIHGATLQAVFGGPDNPDTMPINHVTGQAPPLLLAAGKRDEVVGYGNSERLAARVRAAGGDVQLELYRWATHNTTVGAFAWPLRWTAPVLDQVLAFVAAHGPAAQAAAAKASG